MLTALQEKYLKERPKIHVLCCLMPGIIIIVSVKYKRCQQSSCKCCVCISHRIKVRNISLVFLSRKILIWLLSGNAVQQNQVLQFKVTQLFVSWTYKENWQGIFFKTGLDTCLNRLGCISWCCFSHSYVYPTNHKTFSDNSKRKSTYVFKSFDLLILFQPLQC